MEHRTDPYRSLQWCENPGTMSIGSRLVTLSLIVLFTTKVWGYCKSCGTSSELYRLHGECASLALSLDCEYKPPRF